MRTWQMKVINLSDVLWKAHNNNEEQKICCGDDLSLHQFCLTMQIKDGRKEDAPVYLHNGLLKINKINT